MDTEELTPTPVNALDPSVLRGARPWVLLAVEDAVARGALAEALRDFDLPVIEAPTGTAMTVELVRARTQKDEPHLLIADVDMQGLSPVELICALRCWGSRCPAILMVPPGPAAGWESLTRMGALALPRPVAPSDLIAAVEGLLTWADPDGNEWEEECLEVDGLE